ncbi:MAG: M15 family metallopeptidase [Bacteroidetes bacterium]|nr:M15 family metallopeptidase [Bacteroidota bacterium]
MKLLLVVAVLQSAFFVHSQNKYGLHPTNISGYRSSVQTNPENELVDLQEFIPGLVLDIRYATKNNFTGEQIYRLPKAYARKPVALALKKAQEEFKRLGYSIKIYDAYRPYSATVKFYELMKGDTTYVASPYHGSRHNRGCAIDMTLVDLKTGQELSMPTTYDAMQKESWPTATIGNPVIVKNRDTLIAVMAENSFKVYPTEWWHFDFTGWQKYEVMDIDFEELR